MDRKYAAYLLEKTRQDYNTIAKLFSKTRSYVWKELEPLLEYVEEGDRILDLGCGNGRLFDFFKDKRVDYTGVDNSEKLIEIAKNRYPGAKFQVADALNSPFSANYFDKIYSIAVLHHIPSKKFRLQFLREAQKVLKPGGLLILTVWNLWQKKFLRYHLKYNFLKLIGRSKLDFTDILYRWKSPQGKVIIQRYIHCFTKEELKRLAKKSGFKIKETGFSNRGRIKKANIYLVAEKV